MAAYYDNSIIEEIKFRNDIEDVIGSYVNLTRAGSNMKGLCPFHSEKSASFTVFSATKSFYCFGCGAGGDVVTFIKRIENLDYPGALEFLAKRAGIALPDRDTGAQTVSRARMYDMNRDAARFFHQSLKESAEGLEYLQKRQLSGSAIKRFGLGYAPDGFALLDHMRRLGYTDEELVTGFLCGRSKKNGRLYPYFRGRVMFPIIDVAGNVAAFGGRIIGEGEPKYLNSSDTPVFKKTRTLYALNYAKTCCADSMILCEGYMDVIALHAAGFGNAVATLGTAITSEHARMMKKYTKSVIISYDSDGAGQRAADKAFKMLEEVGLDVRVLRMEGAKDPDEYIKTFGADKFRLLLNKSVSRFDFELGNILSRNPIELTEGRIKAAEEAAEYISRVYSSVERELYITAAAAKLNIAADSLKNDVERAIKRNQRDAKQKDRQKIYIEASAIGDRVNPDAAKNLRCARAEDAVLGLLLNRPEFMAQVKSGQTELTPDDFYTEYNKRIFSLMLENTGEDGVFDTGYVGEALTDEEMGRLTRLQIERDGLTNDGRVFAECIETLKSSKQDKSLEDIINVKRKRIKNQ